MRRYGILIIGCGHIGQEHIADIYYRDNIRVIAVVDQERKRAEYTAHRYGIPEFGSDYRPYLNDNRVDIVVIATYASSHLPILQDCLAMGKHVLCEKPIATKEEDGCKFRDCVKQAKTKVLVAHVLRHNMTYRKVHDLIREGAIGNFRLARMVQNHHAMDWVRYRRLLQDCSPIVDCGVHYIDILQWFAASPIVEVSGMETSLDKDSPGPNYGILTMRLKNGCMGYYEAGWSRNTAAQNLKEFIGDRGRIRIELQNFRFEDKEEGDRISLFHSDTGDYQIINVPSVYKNMYGQLCHLIDMIERNVPADPTIDEVYSAFHVALTAEKAMREKRTMFIEKSGEREEAFP